VRRLAPALAIIPLLAISFLGGYYSGINNTAQGMQAQQEADNAIVITPILRIYDGNGRLLYEKVGDPPTHNLAHLFFINIAAHYKTDNNVFSIVMTTLDGSSATFYTYKHNGDYHLSVDDHTLWVVAGTDTNPPSYNDNTVSLAGYSEAKVANYYFDQTSNEWVMQITGTIIFNAAYNVTSVGLTVDAYGSGGQTNIDDPQTHQNRNILIFRDLLPTPIQVSNGDSISVQYEIHFKLP